MEFARLLFDGVMARGQSRLAVSILAGKKSRLREVLRARRDGIAVLDRSKKSAYAAELLLALPRFQRAEVVALYASIGSELQTAVLFARLVERGTTVVLPRVPGPVDKHVGEMEFVAAHSLASLALGAFGIPTPTGEAVAKATIDVVITPGLGFDVDGGRLGYGGGYYDRFLSDYAGMVVGIGYELQVVESGIPTDERDRPVDYLVTESRVATCGSGRQQ